MHSAEIRRGFIDYFVKKHGHAFVPSSPVVPHGDPTLLFTNAGMNQFKPIFLGSEKPQNSRVANSQKCIRAGGKHNDLDDVGKDTYHHTFFEMLGNWSFGDYFKAEAIEWAWDLLVNVWKLDPERLHATYFEGDAAESLDPDEEARRLWLRYLPAERIHPGNKKDNFWEMGDTGPCGPCSEIHYDRTPDRTGGRLVNAGVAEVIEIWNLVFIQFNRTIAGLKPLPAKHVDTGMGFERICAVIQGKNSNYDTDVFTPILSKISEISSQTYGGELDDPRDIAFRAIADHVRMATFAIADGARPGSNKADSVLRSVIRRASRHGYTALGLREPFLYKLVPTVVEQMGEAFPELRERADHVAQVIRDEEADFLKVIDRGLSLFEEAQKHASRKFVRKNQAAAKFGQAQAEAGQGYSIDVQDDGGRFLFTDNMPNSWRDWDRPEKPVLRGEDIFELHTTYGFPPDMTIQLARDDGFSPDVADYERRFRAFQDQSRGGEKLSVAALDFGNIPETDDREKYDCLNATAQLVGYVQGDSVFATGAVQQGQEASLLLDRTCFYAEQGGQVGDTGTIRSATGEFEVHDTARLGSRVLHRGRVSTGSLKVGQQIDMHVNNRRRAIMANHTATHLLNLALREVLGDHVEQRGSLVDDEKTRFDFSHPKALDPGEIQKTERRVNTLIQDNVAVRARDVPLAKAKALPGVRAVFGEKYPDPVRVVYVCPGELEDGDGKMHSMEFCGGTHASRTGDIGFFKIVGEESVSKGVRRITAITGEDALEYVQRMDADLRSIGQALSAPAEEAPARILALREEVRTLKKKLASGGGGVDPSSAAGSLLDSAEVVGGARVVVGEMPDATDEQLRQAADAIKARAGSFAAMLASANAEKVMFVAAVSDDLIRKGLKAGDWVRETAAVAGGGGGGRPNLAQAGGKHPEKLQEALKRAKEVARRVLG